MRLPVLLFCSLFIFSGCTVYTEKQTEAVSQSVYATKDSIDLARIDLADSYINETIKLINPPKKRLPVNAIYQKPVKVGDSDQRIVIVPEQYKNDKVVVVNSADYSELLKDKENASKLRKDNETLTRAKQEFEKERIKQREMSDKMIIKLNEQQQIILKQRLVILWEGIIIVVLLAIICGYIYIRMNTGFKLF
jgi:hypothetical protein